jgi:GT2 family glycosyltransferase
MVSVSIIVPIFDGIRYLPYFFRSLAEAAPPHAELILVDDGSTEPVLDAVPDDLPVASLTKLRNEQNQGYSAAVNRGFACAHGEILVQLNTDLVLDRHCIEAMVRLIENTPKVGVVGSKQVFPTTGLVRHIAMAFGEYSFRYPFSGLQSNHPLCCKTRAMQIVSGATVGMTRQVLEDIGPLDERYYNTHEDLDHCLKAHRRGYVNYTCADSIAYHWESQSGPARFARGREGDALFWAEWYSRRTIDLGSFVDEGLDYILDKYPQIADYEFEPLDLCRSTDKSILLGSLEKRWNGISTKTRSTRAFNSAQRKLWLPMEVPYWAMMNPTPYIYLVDECNQLSENHMWFDVRSRLVQTELVLDTMAVSATTADLFAYGRRPIDDTSISTDARTC